MSRKLTMELRIKNWEGEERGRDRARKVARSKEGEGMASVSRKSADSPFRHRMTFVYLSSGIIIRLSPP